MKIKSALLGAAVAIFTVASAANATTYTSNESFGGAVVNLSITTDGATGILSQSDITSWSIAITDSAASVVLDPTSGQVLLTGSVLSATSTDLYFNFSSSLDYSGLLIFENASIGDNGPFWCATNGGCYGESFPAIGVSTVYGESPIEQFGLAGNTVIASSGVPETSTWVMMLAGFAGLGFLGYRRNKAATLAA
jgi:hypothetical protein